MRSVLHSWAQCCPPHPASPAQVGPREACVQCCPAHGARTWRRLRASPLQPQPRWAGSRCMRGGAVRGRPSGLSLQGALGYLTHCAPHHQRPEKNIPNRPAKQCHHMHAAHTRTCQQSSRFT